MHIASNSLPALPVGRIAARLPGATGVFQRYNIDFCCHGDVPLNEAAERLGLDVTQISTELAALDETAAPAAPQETGALIDHIQTRYHAVHRRQLPELVALSRKVEMVHASHPDVPAGLADLMQQMIGEMEVHMKKEELLLFPAMRRQADVGFKAPIAQMRHDHDDHGAALQRLGRLTHDQTPPEDACGSWRALYAGVAEFKADLMEHIHLENNVLFPRFEVTAPA